VNVDIPLYQLSVVCGPSGSGKSSLAFDLLVGEGRRCASYKRGSIDFLPPTIGLDQRRFPSLHCTLEEWMGRPKGEEKERIRTLLRQLGVHYLGMERIVSSLSGGELQRVRLAMLAARGGNHLLYVLDEPSSGLHAEDRDRLIGLLCSMRDRGNTIVVVEHDEEMILHADHVIEMGWGSGDEGGYVLNQGELSASLPTGSYICRPRQLRNDPMGMEQWLSVANANHQNLKSIECHIPLCKLSVVTGVSGAGKSTLVREHIAPLYDRVVDLFPSFSFRHHRATPLTYLGVLRPITDLLACLPEAKKRGYTAQRLRDFFRKQEEGTDLENMQYKGKTLRDMTSMSLREWKEHFATIPWIESRLHNVERVGIGYLKAQQLLSSLSEGEAQRLRLVKAITQRKKKGKKKESTLYLLDEPMRGLHGKEVTQMKQMMHALVQGGHTVLCIEHHLDLIADADWVIDLGPEGGERGGYLTGQGTPTQIAKQSTATGRALRRHLFLYERFQQRERAGSNTFHPGRCFPLMVFSHDGSRPSSPRTMEIGWEETTVSIPLYSICFLTSADLFKRVITAGKRSYIELLPPKKRVERLSKFTSSGRDQNVPPLRGIPPLPISLAHWLQQELAELFVAHGKVEQGSVMEVVETIKQRCGNGRIELFAYVGESEEPLVWEQKGYEYTEGWIRVDVLRKKKEQRLLHSLQKASDLGRGRVCYCDDGCLHEVHEVYVCQDRKHEGMFSTPPQSSQRRCVSCSGVGCSGVDCAGCPQGGRDRSDRVRLKGKTIDQWRSLALSEVAEGLYHPYQWKSSRVEALLQAGFGDLSLNRLTETLPFRRQILLRWACAQGEALSGWMYLSEWSSSVLSGVPPDKEEEFFCIFLGVWKRLKNRGNNVILRVHGELEGRQMVSKALKQRYDIYLL